MIGEIKRLKRSFTHAIDGMLYALKKERNFQLELVIGFFVIMLIFIFKVKAWEAVILLLMIMWVLVTELTNTVFERIVDILKPKIHPYARLVKDMMAAVVLISSLFAVAVGIVIFYPYVRDIFGF